MVYMHHSFLIHSSADGHLGCFHVLSIINSAAMNIGVHVRRPRFDSWVRKMHWRREQLPTPVFLPGESYGQRSLAGYSPWVAELDTTEQLTLYFHILPL